jgi:predicted amidohydrolase YtcJ
MSEDDVKGSLEPGKLADLAVLERDPHTAATNDLRRLRVDMTLLGGEILFDRTAS